MHAKIGSVSPMKHIPLRLWAFANDFLVFCSSAIVTGIISYFLHNYSYRGVHVVYQEVIVRYNPDMSAQDTKLTLQLRLPSPWPCTHLQWFFQYLATTEAN